ncbi:MAG TPA: hypothetical protein VFJ89_09940 [Nocardioides sp.]|nr:hypothetical protein [Nocardioides sp.]
MSAEARSRLRSPVALVLVGLVVLLLLAGIVGHIGDDTPSAAAAASHEVPDHADRTLPAALTPHVPAYAVVPAPPPLARRPGLPGGGQRIFGHHRFLVAYYGTAGTGSMGVLGATDPATMNRRLLRAARPFARPGEQIQPVYELIVTVADRSPGPDGDYSHDIPRALVARYVRAAHRHGALLLLDLQTGRASFPSVARRWAWALADPWVGLALDPEWRMGRHQVPASVIGSVRAREVNRTSRWLARLVRRHGLPEKLFVLHQFRLSMLPDLDRVVHRPGLAMVQHADGFGSRGQKLATYHAITRPRQFRQGFKLFYHWDRHRFTPRQVRRIRPRVSFVSYQ